MESREAEAYGWGVGSWAERNVVNRAVRLGARLGREIDGVRELEVRRRRSAERL
jgi:hypothetical protein